MLRAAAVRVAHATPAREPVLLETPWLRTSAFVLSSMAPTLPPNFSAEEHLLCLRWATAARNALMGLRAPPSLPAPARYDEWQQHNPQCVALRLAEDLLRAADQDPGDEPHAALAPQGATSQPLSTPEASTSNDTIRLFLEHAERLQETQAASIGRLQRGTAARTDFRRPARRLGFRACSDTLAQYAPAHYILTAPHRRGRAGAPWRRSERRGGPSSASRGFEQISLRSSG